MILIPRNLLALIVLEDLAAAPNASTLKSFKAPIFNTAIHPPALLVMARQKQNRRLLMRKDIPALVVDFCRSRASSSPTLHL